MELAGLVGTHPVLNAHVNDHSGFRKRENRDGEHPGNQAQCVLLQTVTKKRKRRVNKL